MKECPAYNHKCKFCNRDHHYDSLCRSKDNPKVVSKASDASHSIQEAAVFDEFSQLCTVTAINRSRGPIAMEHHQFNNLRDTWMKGPSRAQPYIRLNVATKARDYKDLGYDLPTQERSVSLEAMADTGCQSCLIGLRSIERLGLGREDLIPVTMTMRAANEKGIEILGAAILRFSGTGKPGHLLETRQIAYVTSNSDRLFISRDACEQLGMITSAFPTIGETHHQACAMNQSPSVSTSACTTDNMSSCDCPKRELPKPLPTELPFPATTVNTGKLKAQIHTNYTCTIEHPVPRTPYLPQPLLVRYTSNPEDKQKNRSKSMITLRPPKSQNHLSPCLTLGQRI